MWLIITNDSSWIPGILFGFTPFGAWMLLEANRLFGFCLTHRLMIYHISLVYMLIREIDCGFMGGINEEK